MALQVELIGASQPFSAAEVVIERALGREVRWQFALHLVPDNRNLKDAQDVAQLLQKAPVNARPLWNGAEMASYPIQVVGARWSPDQPSQLLVDGHGTRPGDGPDPFVPRRRVHRVEDLRGLLDRLDNVARVPMGVLSKLQKIRFPDKARASIVQDGLSDWEFFHRVLAQYPSLQEGEPALQPLALSGSVDQQAGTAGHWLLNWGSAEAYRQAGHVTAREVDFTHDAGDERTRNLAFQAQADGERTQAFPTGASPSVSWRRKESDPNLPKWREWSGKDVPLFIRGSQAFVWQVRDRVYQAGPDEDISWATEVATLPPGFAISGSTRDPALAPWIGLGTVSKSSPEGPWIKVRLAGFQSGEDELEARISTPYAGKDGTKGLHLVPEEGTPVLLAWSGRLDQSVIVAANAREAAAQFASPSLWLEALATTQYEDILCKKVGKITVESDLDTTVQSNLKVTVQKQTNVDSTMSMKVKGENAGVELRAGVVYLGTPS